MNDTERFALAAAAFADKPSDALLAEVWSCFAKAEFFLAVRPGAGDKSWLIGDLAELGRTGFAFTSAAEVLKHGWQGVISQPVSGPRLGEIARLEALDTLIVDFEVEGIQPFVIGRAELDALAKGLAPWTHVQSNGALAGAAPGAELSLDEEIAQFIVNWQLEIRAGQTSPAELFDVLPERAGQFFYEKIDPALEPGLIRKLRLHTEAFLAMEQRREEGWTGPTHNDLLSAAFEELRARGLTAPAYAGKTIQDGWGYAVLAAKEQDRGALFFHQEDIFDALNGQGLLLAFGAYELEPRKHERATLQIGREIMTALGRFGIEAAWEESARARIRLPGFEWRKRRWTVAPPIAPAAKEPRAQAKEARPPLWAMLREILPGAKAQTAAPPEAATRTREEDRLRLFALDKGFVQKVYAVRDERGFDEKLSAVLRGAWKSLGGERAQIGHAGTPHVFVSAGELTSLAPQSAFDNIGEEAAPIRERALAARRARE